MCNALVELLYEAAHRVEVVEKVDCRWVTKRSNCGEFSTACAILAVKGRMLLILRSASFS